MSTENQTVPEAEQPSLADLSDRILSISWNNGILGAVYYDLASMEVTIGRSIFI